MATQVEQNRIKELEAKVDTLMKFMEEKKRQQISFPLDSASKNVINNI